jgi:hypothetical protein
VIDTSELAISGQATTLKSKRLLPIGGAGAANKVLPPDEHAEQLKVLSVLTQSVLRTIEERQKELEARAKRRRERLLRQIREKEAEAAAAASKATASNLPSFVRRLSVLIPSSKSMFALNRNARQGKNNLSPDAQHEHEQSPVSLESPSSPSPSSRSPQAVAPSAVASVTGRRMTHDTIVPSPVASTPAGSNVYHLHSSHHKSTRRVPAQPSIAIPTAITKPASTLLSSQGTSTGTTNATPQMDRTSIGVRSGGVYYTHCRL